MPSFAILKTVFRELITSERSPRVPEPDLVMDDPGKVAAYTRASREDGVIAQTYLFNCAQICEILRPGDIVVDLACGPATQLAMVARLNPETHFIGVDLSEGMLQRAQQHADNMKLENIEFRNADITSLDFFETGSIDAVISTLSVHHLPTVEHLDRTFSEISRILKPGGGLYLSDFTHLKSDKSIEYFAHQYEELQPELFTEDYLNSLRAAFYLDDIKEMVAKHLASRGQLYSMYPMPFMFALKSPSRREHDPALQQSLTSIRQTLPPYIQTDLHDLISLFRRGGLPSKLLEP